jgi:hypothetical protein
LTQCCSAPCVICHIKHINNFERTSWIVSTSKENKICKTTTTRLRERESCNTLSSIQCVVNIESITWWSCKNGFQLKIESERERERERNCVFHVT